MSQKYQIIGEYCPRPDYNRRDFIKRHMWTPVELFGWIEVAQNGDISGLATHVYSLGSDLIGKLEGNHIQLVEIHDEREDDPDNERTGKIIWEATKQVDGAACGWAGTYKVQEGLTKFSQDIGSEGIIIFSCVPMEQD